MCYYQTSCVYKKKDSLLKVYLRERNNEIFHSKLYFENFVCLNLGNFKMCKQRRVCVRVCVCERAHECMYVRMHVCVCTDVCGYIHAGTSKYSKPKDCETYSSNLISCLPQTTTFSCPPSAGIVIRLYDTDRNLQAIDMEYKPQCSTIRFGNKTCTATETTFGRRLNGNIPWCQRFTAPFDGRPE